MTRKGIIKGNWIELEDAPELPEGTKVEVVIQKSLVRGSPQTLLAYWNDQPLCSPEEVAALIREMELGRRNVRFEGVFDSEQKAP